MVTSFIVSTPPTMTRSERPRLSSAIPVYSAASELAQAASVVWLMPCRSNLLAMRPLMTLVSSPGNVSSCHGT
jgi:hypothetical protein